MATSVNYIQGNSLRIILPLMVIQLHEDGTTTEGSFVPLDGDIYVVTLKGQRQYRYTPTIEVVDGDNCAVVELMGIENYGTYGIEIVVTRADGTRLRYANPDALTLEQYTGTISGGGDAPLIIGGVVLDPSLFIFAKGDRGDDGADGADGTDGVGVVSIVQTTTSTESGGINVITCTLTNGDVSTFEIRNGKDGGGSSITIDPSPTQGSTNAVASGGVYDALQGKQNTLTFDNVPTEDSLNPVKSGGIFDALKTKQDTLTFDNTPTQYSINPVKSGGVYEALQTAYSAIVEVVWDDALQIYKSNTVRTNDLVEAYAHNQDIQLKFAGGEWNGIRLNLFGNDNSTFYFTGIVNEFEYQATVEPSGNNPIIAQIGYAHLQTSLTFDNVPTANSNNPVKSSGIYNMCPIIEDTRSSAVAAITGVAPFASLVDGQRIVLHLKYATTNNTTLSLTLSGGGATAAKPIKASYRFAGNGSVGLDINIRSNSYVGLVWDATNDWWHTLSDIDTDTINAPVSLTDVTNESTLSRAITGKFIHDNISLKRTVVTTGSALTADTYLELGTTDTVAPTLPATYTDADEFIFSFTCDTAACSVTLPTGVVLADNCDNFSEVAAGVFFQVSIMDDVAAYLCVTPTTP